jgi:hypothetical protein
MHAGWASARFTISARREGDAGSHVEHLPQFSEKVKNRIATYKTSDVKAGLAPVISAPDGAPLPIEMAGEKRLCR